MESLELFGREVLPEFKERELAGAEAKAKRLQPVVEAALARRVDAAPPMPDDYTMIAMPKAMAAKSGSKELDEMLEKVAEDRAAGRRDPNAGILG